MRTKLVTIRCTEEELTTWTALAQEEGRSLAALIRHRLRGEPKGAPEATTRSKPTGKVCRAHRLGTSPTIVAQDCDQCNPPRPDLVF